MPEDRDQLAELGKVAGALVHELKNPLSVALLNAEMLLSQDLPGLPEGALRDRAGKRLRRILDSTRNLQAIVQSFLAFARPARPDPEAVELNALFRHLIEEQAESDSEAGVSVVFHPDPQLARVPADATHLRSVFRNVLVNAREALREKEGERRILIITRRAHEAVRIVIANNGPPLPEQVAARLFQPFVSSKPNGTGLGLAIVRRLVAMHGGTVAVTSDPHQGVSFTFEFPTTLGPAVPATELPMPEVEAVVREAPATRHHRPSPRNRARKRM